MIARRSVKAKSMYNPMISCALNGLRNDHVAMNFEMVSGRNQSRAMNMLRDGTPPKRCDTGFDACSSGLVPS